MLSYIWQQHCRIVAFSRCLVVECGMTALKVVSMDILPDGTPCLTDVVILRQISFFILEAAEPALNHDVICPPAFPVHAQIGRASCRERLSIPEADNAGKQK